MNDNYEYSPSDVLREYAKRVKGENKSFWSQIKNGFYGGFILTGILCYLLLIVFAPISKDSDSALSLKMLKSAFDSSNLWGFVNNLKSYTQIFTGAIVSISFGVCGLVNFINPKENSRVSSELAVVIRNKIFFLLIFLIFPIFICLFFQCLSMWHSQFCDEKECHLGGIGIVVLILYLLIGALVFMLYETIVVIFSKLLRLGNDGKIFSWIEKDKDYKKNCKQIKKLENKLIKINKKSNTNLIGSIKNLRIILENRLIERDEKFYNKQMGRIEDSKRKLQVF